jgi:hypothetical protein
LWFIAQHFQAPGDNPLVDDRILFIPTVWAPNPESFERWAAARILLERLRAFLPVDIFIWPTARRGQPPETGIENANQAIRASLRANHHVVAPGHGDTLLAALDTRFVELRSLVVAGFFPSPATLRACGLDSMSGAMEGVYHTLRLGVAQLVPISMQGASEEEIQEIVNLFEGDVDRGRLQSAIDLGSIYNALEDPPLVSVPALYLTLPLAIPGAEEMADLFRRFVPNTEVHSLSVWGLQQHREEGGIELAEKVIAFIQRVIAERRTS